MSPIVLDLTEREESVSLRSQGFESCTVRPPSPLAERLSLRRSYRYPSRANPSVFVDELLALCVEPRQSPGAVRALEPGERALLRRAVVAVTDEERTWQALYGSHLTLDERLFAVMYWRWQARKGRFTVTGTELERFAVEGRYAAEVMAKNLGVDPGGWSVPDSVAAQALRAIRSPAHLAGLVPAAAFDFEKTMATYRSVTGSLGVGYPAHIHPGIVGAGYPTHIHAGILGAGNPLHAAALSAVESASPVADLISLAESASAAARPHLSVSERAAGLTGLLGADSSASVLSQTEQSLLKLAQAGMPVWGVAQAPNIAKALETWESPVAAAAGLSDWFGLGGSEFSTLSWASQMLPGLNEALRRQLEPMRELMEATRVIDRFDRQWQQEALYYFLASLRNECDIWEIHDLATLPRDRVSEAILYALEEVVLGAPFIAMLREEVARAPHLNRLQRINLDHGLEHAGKGEYAHALSPLYGGVEGAFMEVAIAQAVITIASNPRKRKKIKFESVVGRLSVAQELKTFMKRAVFGTVGNQYRHGSASDGERRQVLFCVAALAGWFEQFTNVPARQCLVELMAQTLPAATARARSLQLRPGDPS
jgi:hypothetical protein